MFKIVNLRVFKSRKSNSCALDVRLRHLYTIDTKIDSICAVHSLPGAPSLLIPPSCRWQQQPNNVKFGHQKRFCQTQGGKGRNRLTVGPTTTFKDPRGPWVALTRRTIEHKLDFELSQFCLSSLGEPLFAWH